jgi:hypothetical protein
MRLAFLLTALLFALPAAAGGLSQPGHSRQAKTLYDRLAALPQPGRPGLPDPVAKAGSCRSIGCESEASNDCPAAGGTCECWCDDFGNGVCSDCD